jgi:hypothetical protein
VIKNKIIDQRCLERILLFGPFVLKEMEKVSLSISNINEMMSDVDQNGRWYDGY